MAEAVSPTGSATYGTGLPRPPRFSIRKDAEGRLVPRHHVDVDPGLVGEKAFTHPATRRWWRWLLEEYEPAYSVALVTPCSSVKPYTRSPTSRKIRGGLRRLGLWDEKEDKPRGLVWLYFSDLLILVPYERAEEYPPCCYEVPPDLVLGSPELAERVSTLLAEAVKRLVDRGLEKAILFLPRKHKRLWSMAREKATRWPRERMVGYTLFSTRELLEAIYSDVRVP